MIFGVGLIGGSLALALRQSSSTQQPPTDLQIVGIGRNEDSLQEALNLGVINIAETHLNQALKNADIVVIATPVAQTPQILRAILPFLEPQTVITDVGSTKADVMACAETILGEKSIQFVAGHPIAGAEKSGVSAAKADLFNGKNIVLTPRNHTNAEALDKVRAMWRATGAKVSEMTADEHDSIFAAVSHLPHLLAFALVAELASRENAPKLFNFAASGFRDFTRIAGSSPEMWRDITLANRQALLKEIAAYQNALLTLQQDLKNQDAEALQSMFEHASLARNAWNQ